MAFRGGWLSSAAAAVRGVSSNLAAGQASVSKVQSFHSTAACLKQKFFGTVISDAMDKSGKRSAAPRLCTQTLLQQQLTKRSGQLDLDVWAEAGRLNPRERLVGAGGGVGLSLFVLLGRR